MSICKRRHGFAPLALCLAGCLAISQSVSAGAGEGNQKQPDYALEIRGESISLQATDVPLSRIILDIGQRMNIQVVAQIGDSERISAEFKDLPLEKALRRLSRNHALIIDDEGGAISKIFLLPRGRDAPSDQAGAPAGSLPSPGSAPADARARAEDRPKPFEFQLDPSQSKPSKPPQ